MKKILITGSAGFIGFHLCKALEKNYSLVGIDNLNNYYDKQLKIDRLKQLSKDFSFFEIDIKSKKDISRLFKTNKFDYVFHLAAQAGVRYSFQDPDSYINNNIIGTYNILENLKHNNQINFLFASSSSVYGYSDKNIGFKESSESSKPVSLYSSTKKSCEVLIHNYSYNFKIPSTILRFFTVYGPWGRPDMALFKFTNSILNEEPINVYNEGEMWRDFTYIDDLINYLKKLLSRKTIIKNEIKNNSLSMSAPYRILNLGNQNTVKLSHFISTLEKVIGKKAKKNFLKMQAGDVPFTLSDNTLLNRIIENSPSTSLEEGLKKFYNWYRNYYIDRDNL